MPDDKLTLTLDSLRSDVERTPLADSRTVRRRGDRRTRNQAVGGSLAVVALVAGAVGLYGGLGGDKRATRIPASPTPTAEQTFQLADAPLIGPDDLGTVGSYTGWQLSPDPVPDGEQVLRCIPNPSTLGGTEVLTGRLYSDSDAYVVEHVVRFDDARAATGAIAPVSEDFATCDPGDPAETSVEDRGPVESDPVEGVDQLVHASRTGTPVQASEISYYELGIVRRGNVVVVLQWSSQGRPDNGSEWVFANELLDVAAHRAIK
jgi:hypothetical protein